MKGCLSQCSQLLYTSGSHPGAKPIIRTNCSRRCALALVVTWKNRNTEGIITSRSDALVLRCHRRPRGEKIFPALQAMLKPPLTRLE